MTSYRSSLCVCLLLMVGFGRVGAQTVRITPLGSRTGELCNLDVALLFEDPTGVRILYDPGVAIAGGTDARLGDVHVILVSHFHFDHIGNRKLAGSPDSPTAGCGNQNTIPTENTNAAEIAAAKSSAVLVGVPMASFLAQKIAKLRGEPTRACVSGVPAVLGMAAGLSNELIVPRASPCPHHMSFGTRTMVTRSTGKPGVRIAMVHAQHDDTVADGTITESLAAPLSENGLGGYGGSPNGYVLTFSNGLKVYLSGDTGPTSDMLNIVHGFYQVNLAVVNMDGVFVMGPEEAAYAVRNLIQPQAVIVSHVSENATVNGVAQPSTRTAGFLELMQDFPVWLPLSGRTMEFDGEANCVAGCRTR